MNEFSEEKLQEFEEAFNIFDEDKDGFLEKTQFQLVLMCLGFELTDFEINEIFEEFLTEKISFANMVKYLGSRNKNYEFEEELMECFEDIDKDKDGKINAKELKYYLLTLGEKLTDEEVNELIEQANPNGGGFFRYKDFLKLMLSK